MRTPGDPEARVARVNAGLRLAGLAILAFAFLLVSRSFTSGDDPTTPTRPAVVYADEALRAVLPKLGAHAQYRFGAPADLAAQIADGAKADVLLSSDPAGLTALARAKHCAAPRTFATTAGTTRDNPSITTDAAASTPEATSPPAAGGLTTFGACAVIRSGASAAVATRFADELTSIRARQALLDAGYDVPQNR